MKKLVLETFMIFVGLGVAVALLAGLEDNMAVETIEVSTVFTQHTKPQAIAKKDLREIETQKLFELSEPGDPLWGPIAAKLDTQGRLMVMDYGDWSVKLISDQGSLASTIGNGEGQGPGEFLGITDVAIHDQEIWVADSTNSRLSSFDHEGRVLATLKLSTSPYRIASISSSGILVMHSMSELNVFGEYARDGTSRRQFGQLVNNPLDGLALDGYMARTSEGSFVFVGRYWGGFSLFDASGQRVYSRQTLNPTPVPKLVKKKALIRPAPDTQISALSASVSEQRLYLLRGTQYGRVQGEEVDVYTLENGDYLYSFLLPQPSTSAHFHRDFMVLTQWESVSKWSFEVKQ